MSDILPFAQVHREHADLVGGKGLSLGLTATTGLPVPPGFCVTTAAFRRLGPELRIDAALCKEMATAYRELGGGLVAVRSSATAEDGAVTSFAGQQETILGVEGEDALRDAVERCWRSLHTDRARAYRERQAVDESSLAMAVVVQRLVDAEVAGVMFTRDPLDPTGSLMRIEAAWGLGEVVVSGRVTPDRYQVERDGGRVRDRQPGHKHFRVTRHGEQPVPSDRANVLCLTDDQLGALADLGRRVETFYGDARDIEWAIADGQVWLLQARPITTPGAGDRERVRRATIDRLAKLVEPGGTVWSRTNLIEVLAEPTPMTWAVVSGKLLSGGGGTGAMFRDFGFKPDPALAATSAYDLIGGRPYMNLAREPRLESSKPLAGYPLAKYKDSPHLALEPKRESPGMMRQLVGLFGAVRVATKIAGASQHFTDEFRTTHIPAFVELVDRANGEDLSKLDLAALVKRFESWVDETLVSFARHSLKPTLLAQFSWQVLEQQIGKAVGPDRARAILAELSQGAKSDPDADLPGAIRDLAAGILPRDEFLRRFGHRGPNEMELSAPRWAENSASLAKLTGTIPHQTPRPPADVLEDVAAEVKWNSMLAKSMAGHVERLQTYLGLRETAKHHLMRGYAIIRQTLLELDRRFGLEGGIFYLTPDELPALIARTDLKPTIAERRRTRAVELSLEVPPVVFGDDLEAIGRPLPAPAGTEELTGVPLSAGVVEGPALVLTEPTATPTEGGYILVCPSTDPAWVPLFVNARGLVMESGGTLSHGAIVAREFGLPAVAGLPGVQHRIQTGQRLRIDGGRGTVSVVP
jgi:phosphohistidine swiveling domain-containing protein